MALASDSFKLQNSYFHALSKVSTNGSTQYPFESLYKTSHTIRDKDIWAEALAYCATSTDADNFVTANPTIVKKYTQIPLTMIPGSNGLAWYINDGGNFVKSIILPVDVPQNSTNLPSIGFQPSLYKGDSTLIPITTGVYQIIADAGMVIMQAGYTPSDLGWGTPKITCYTYIGKSVKDTVGATIPEAPTDGKIYGRRNSAWTIVTAASGSGGGIPEAPVDGNLYGRKDGAWSQVSTGTSFAYWEPDTFYASGTILLGDLGAFAPGYAISAAILRVYNDYTSSSSNVLDDFNNGDLILLDNYNLDDYALLGGRPGGQNLFGGENTGESLTLTNNYADVNSIELKADGVLSANTIGYENLVINDNDIPNKKYVDLHSGSGTGSLNPFVKTIQFDTNINAPAYNGGTVYWDKTFNTLSVQTGLGNSTLQVGQESYVRCCNVTGSTITNGTVVYINGADIAHDSPTIEKAVADNYDKSRIIGVLTEDILSGDCGFVTSFGNVNDLDTSAFQESDIVFLSPIIPGALTTVRPTGGNFLVIVGIITKVSSTVGRLFVFPKAQDYTVEVLQNVGWSPSALPTITTTNTASGAVVTLTPTGSQFSFYQYGDKYDKVSDSIHLPNEEGLYLVYYNLGVLSYIKNPVDSQIDTIIKNNTTVADVYWNAANSKCEYVGNELHIIGMSSSTHAYLHYVLKCRYLSGLSPVNIISDASGSLNTSAQFGLTSGAITDENNYFSITSTVSVSGFPIAYLAGTNSSPLLRTTVNPGFSVLTTGSGRLAYNQLLGGNYLVSEVPNGDFACCHLIALNENSIAKRVFAFMGQTSYTTLTNARVGAQTELENLRIVGILPQEVKAIATFIFETSNTFSNLVKARIRTVSTGVDFVDWRNTQIAGVAGSGNTQSTIFQDSTFQIYDGIDPTKILQFEVGGITPSTTRVLSAPDKSGTIALDSDVIHTTGTETASGNKTFVNSPVILTLAGSGDRLIGVDSTGKIKTMPTGVVDSITLSAANTFSSSASGNAYLQSITYTNAVSGLLKTYIDTQDTSTLNSAKTYTNSASGNALNSSVTYTNAVSGLLKQYVDTSVTNASGNILNYIDSRKFSHIIDVQKTPYKGQFSSIATAVASITDSSETNTYLVRVSPGLYLEPLIDLRSKPYVSIRGYAIQSVFVEPDNTNHNVFNIGLGNELSFLSIANAGPGYAAINADNCGDFSQLHKISIYDCDYGIVLNANTIDSILYSEYVDLNGVYTETFTITSSGAYSAKCNMENTYAFPGVGNTAPNQIKVSGTKAQLETSSCGIYGNNTGVGVLVTNGAQIAIKSTDIEEHGTGILVDTVGTNPVINITAIYFNNNTLNFNIANSTASGSFTGFTDYSKKSINNANSFFITNKDAFIITVAKKGGDFSSIAAAVDSITDSSDTVRYIISVGAGEFIEPLINIVNKPYISVIGFSILATIVKPDSPTHHVFDVGPSNEILFMTISDAGSGYAGIAVQDSGDYSQAHKVAIYNCDIGVLVTSATQSTIFYGEYLEFDEVYNYGVKVIATNGQTARAHLENYYNYSVGGKDFIGSYATGPGSQLTMVTCGTETTGATGNYGTGIYAQDGATLEIVSASFTGLNKAINIGNVGSPCSIEINGVTCSDNNSDLIIAQPNTSGTFSGAIDKTKVVINAQNVSAVFQDAVVGDYTIAGKLNLRYNNTTTTDISTLVGKSSTMGVFSGGTLSDVGTLTLAVSAGYGYYSVADVIYRYDWNNTSINIPANTTNYVYFNSSNILSLSATLPTTSDNILLGRVRAKTSTLEFLDKSPISADHYSNRASKLFRKGLGTLYSSGSIVTENATPLHINISSGDFFLGTNEFFPSGGTNKTFSTYTTNGSGGYIISSSNTIDNTKYDSAGTLTNMTSGYYAKHSLYVVGDGNDEKYLLVYAQNQYATLLEAQTANIPTPPSYFNDGVALIAGIIVQKGSLNISQIRDLRPVVGFKSEGINASANHGSLLGLANDDHTQYILVNGGRPFSGPQSFGGNAITNVGTVDGVTVSSHASRHLPNGADPLTTAAPTDNLTGSTTNGIGIQNSLARSDHSHAVVLTKANVGLGSVDNVSQITLSIGASGNAYAQSVLYTNSASGNLVTIIVTQDANVLSQAKTYANGASGNALTQAVSYTNAVSGQLKTYVDNQTAATLSQAVTYTNGVSGLLKTYVDSQISTTTATIYTYSNSASGNAYSLSVTYTNAVSGLMKTYIDSKPAGSQTLAQTLALGNDANALKIINLAEPTLSSDAATKNYVDTHSGGGGASGSITTATFILGLGTPVTVGVNKTNVLICSKSGTFYKAYAYAKTGPTGADLILDILKNGASIWANGANRLKIVAGQVSGNTSTFDVTTVSQGDLYTIDVDQVGSTIAGQDITVQLLIIA